MPFNETSHKSAVSHTTTNGLMDLMTSLAIIFILLLAASLAPPSDADGPRAETVTTPARATVLEPDVRSALHRHLQPFGLSVDADPHDPLLMHIVIPDDLLNFEFGQSTLTKSADRFLQEMMPRYAAALCGSLRGHVDSVVIEGHTDDLGQDTVNLRLSQERSFRVMVKGLDVIEREAPSVAACFQRMTSASGRGKQDLIYDPATGVDRGKSRRVIFKIRLRSDEQRRQLAEAAHPSLQKPAHRGSAAF